MGMIRRALIGLLLLAPLAFADEYSATGLTAGSTYRGCGDWENEATPPLTATIICSDEWATTAAGDTTPDAFSFTDLTGQPLGTQIASNAVEITGIDATAVLTLSGDPSCTWAVDGVGGGTEGSVENGQEVYLTVTTEGLYSDQFSCEVTIGGVSDIWYVTTIGEQVAGNLWEWISLQGFTGSRNDQTKKYLNSLGYSGSTNSMLFRWLRDLGYTGSLTTMIDKFERDYTLNHG